MGKGLCPSTLRQRAGQGRGSGQPALAGHRLLADENRCSPRCKTNKVKLAC